MNKSLQILSTSLNAPLIQIKPTQSCSGRKLGRSASPLSPKKKGATLINNYNNQKRALAPDAISNRAKGFVNKYLNRCGSGS
jgi:hypothetical protein